MDSTWQPTLTHGPVSVHQPHSCCFPFLNLQHPPPFYPQLAASKSVLMRTAYLFSQQLYLLLHLYPSTLPSFPDCTSSLLASKARPRPRELLPLTSSDFLSAPSVITPSLSYAIAFSFSLGSFLQQVPFLNYASSPSPPKLLTQSWLCSPSYPLQHSGLLTILQKLPTSRVTCVFHCPSSTDSSQFSSHTTFQHHWTTTLPFLLQTLFSSLAARTFLSSNYPPNSLAIPSCSPLLDSPLFPDLQLLTNPQVQSLDLFPCTLQG